MDALLQDIVYLLLVVVELRYLISPSEQPKLDQVLGVFLNHLYFFVVEGEIDDGSIFCVKQRVLGSYEDVRVDYLPDDDRYLIDDGLIYEAQIVLIVPQE